MPNIIIQSDLTLGVKELAKILHKSVRTIIRDLSRSERRSKLPPVIPSWQPGDRPIWFLPTVLVFLGGESAGMSVQIKVIVNQESSAIPSLPPRIPTLAEGLGFLKEKK